MTAELLQRRYAFAAKAKAPGGLTLEAAVAAGDARLRTLRGRGLARIDVLLAGVAAHAAPGAEVLAGEARSRCRAAAEELAGIAGLFGLEALGRTAGALAEHLADAEETPLSVFLIYLDAAKLVRAAPEGDYDPLIQHLKLLAEGARSQLRRGAPPV